MTAIPLRRTSWIFIPALVALFGCQQAATETAAVEEAPEEQLVDASWDDLVPNARRPLEGVLSGGQPSEDQLRVIAEAGFRTVINLRAAGEEATETEPAAVSALGMEYVSLPVPGAAGITEENARALTSVLDAAERPTLLHCGSGNRVGALLALAAYHVDGLSSEAALDYGLESGLTRLEGTVREHLDLATTP